MPSEPESRFYPRIFALVTAVILAAAVWKILQPFTGAILWSILVAFLLMAGDEESHAPSVSVAGGDG